MSAHARLSASAAHRWLHCAGSVNLSAGRNTTSVHAATGTFAHAIAAECLAHDCPATDFLGRKDCVEGFDVVCDLDMAEAIQVYLDEVNADQIEGDQCWIEMALGDSLAKVDPDLGGTADFVRYRPSDKSLRVFDYKHGSGTYVEADDNPQLKQYALGAMLEVGLPVLNVTVTVVQPRFEGARPVRDHRFPAMEIVDFAADLRAQAAITRRGDAPLAAGDWCNFCPAARDCPELERKQHALMAAEFADLSRVAPAELGAALLALPTVKARIKALEEHAYALAASGVEVPGFKLVDKRPTRKWKSEGDVIEWAQANAVDPWAPREVLSPAQLEKRLGESAPRGKKKEAGKVLEPFVEKVSSGMALVPATDDRPPAKLVSAADFAVVPGP